MNSRLLCIFNCHKWQSYQTSQLASPQALLNFLLHVSETRPWCCHFLLNTVLFLPTKCSSSPVLTSPWQSKSSPPTNLIFHSAVAILSTLEDFLIAFSNTHENTIATSQCSKSVSSVIITLINIQMLAMLILLIKFPLSSVTHHN